ncbi:MAG TPA: 5-dehydro-2-deoxygluconokinase [Candidatus Limnocylindrales bacterium]|nr:5-dehydro-2-deoxygluconokinase [Candidatus Limnocylindrales bacterium]
MSRSYDVLCIGRSSIDLYSNDVGAPFEQITSFAALVGGCPTNISVGTRRLGLKSALLTGVGRDKVGDFIVAFLDREGVETKFIARKDGHRTSAVLLGIQPPDTFPLTFYRDNCADIELTIDDALAAPIADSRLLLISGTGLSQDPSRSTTLTAAENAQAQGTEVVLDIDYRPTLWHDSRAFGITVRTALPLVDIAIGTEDEIKGATGAPTGEAGVARLLEGVRKAVVYKLGEAGARVYTKDGQTYDAGPFKIEVLNTLGAGDAFASGFLYGYLNGWGWQKAARMGNATGAIVVTRQGCANDMPTLADALAFVESKGGF